MYKRHEYLCETVSTFSDSFFDYPRYLEFLKRTLDFTLLKDLAFDRGQLNVAYKHNIPAKDFFKVRVSFFKVKTKPS